MSTDAATEALAAAREALRLAEQAAGASPNEAPVVIDDLTVKQINIVEDDGRLRMVIGNSTHGRTIPLRGDLRRHPGRSPSAGLLFVNDDGTECGGLQFGGGPATGDAPQRQMGYLTFDDFEQNESLRIGLAQHGSTSERFIELVDQPAWSLVDFLDDLDAAPDEQARAAVRRRYAEQGRSASRLLLTRDAAGDAAIVLRDGEGRDRVRLVAPRDGAPDIRVLDENGTARSLLPQATS